jgi:hypothetical protein
MKDKDSTLYICEMLQQFQMPGKDCMTECMLSPDEQAPWDSGVFVSTRQSEGFYTDIFQFWVRTLFCFFEEIRHNSSMNSVAPFVICKQMLPIGFERNLIALLHQHIASETHRERQSFPESFIELEKRTFSESYAVLDCPDLESAVAESDGEYIAYFHRIKRCTLLAQPRTAP